MADIFTVIYQGLLTALERTGLAYTENNTWADTFTNYFAGNHIMNPRELIGVKGSDGRIWFRFSRNYSESPGIGNYGMPLQSAADLSLDPKSGVIFTKKIVDGGVGGEVSPIENNEDLFNPRFDAYGGLDAITGGVFPNDPGDIRIYNQNIADTTFARREAIHSAFEYSEQHSTFLGSAFGQDWYVARFPRITPSNILNIGAYNPSLMNHFWNEGIAYRLLDPIFHLAKEALVKFDQRTPGKKTIVLDPLINAQVDIARKLGKATGGALIPLYLPLLLAKPVIETIEDAVTEPLHSIIDDIFGAAEGLFNPLPPSQKGRSRTIQTPMRGMMSAGGGLSDTGPVDDERIIRGIDFSGAQKLREAA